MVSTRDLYRLLLKGSVNKGVIFFTVMTGNQKLIKYIFIRWRKSWCYEGSGSCGPGGSVNAVGRTNQSSPYKVYWYCHVGLRGKKRTLDQSTGGQGKTQYKRLHIRAANNSRLSDNDRLWFAHVRRNPTCAIAWPDKSSTTTTILQLKIWIEKKEIKSQHNVYRTTFLVCPTKIVTTSDICHF